MHRKDMLRPRMTRLAASLLFAFAPPMVLLGVSRDAFAAFTQAGATITCAAGSNTNSGASSTNGVTFDVNATATVGGSALTLTLNGNRITLNNAEVIDPVVNGGQSLAASGAIPGNSAANAINVNNQASGVLNGLVNSSRAA